MSTTETVEQTDVAPWDPDEPMVAHRAWNAFPVEAMCGARLIGIPVSDPERKCAVCERIWAELFGPET